MKGIEHGIFQGPLKSVQSKSLPKIFDFMREAVLPTLKGIRLVDERRHFLVDDKEFPDSRDLTDYGEGLQRIFFISLSRCF